MILSEKLRTQFFSTWRQDIDAADNFIDFLDISEEAANELYAMSYEYYNTDLLRNRKPGLHYFEKATTLTNFSKLVAQLNVDKTSCYFASVENITFIFTRNKKTLVENMNKMLYVNGWLPIHKKVLRYPSKQIHCALYFTNVIMHAPTLN